MRNFTFAAVLAILSTVSSLSIANDTSACGEAPPMRDEKLKGTIEGKAELLLKSIGSASLKGEIDLQRTEIISRYPGADKALINNRYYYSACFILMKSNRSDDEKLRGLKELRREIIGASSYGVEERAEDRRTINGFVKEFANFKASANGDAFQRTCSSAEVEFTTPHFSIGPERLSFTQVKVFTTKDCRDPNDRIRVVEQLKIEAVLSDLKGAFGVGGQKPISGGYFASRMMPAYVERIEFSCQVGQCISVSRAPDAQTSSYEGWFIRVSADSSTTSFKQFARALSRTISAGSDDALCQKYEALCA